MTIFHRLAGLLAFGLLSCQLPAQAQAWLWAKGVHANPTGVAAGKVLTAATAITPGGEVYAAYQYLQAITFNGQTYQSQTPNQQYGSLLARYDASGAVTAVLMSGTNARIFDVETDAAGNVYATGRFGGQLQVTGAAALTATTPQDVFVAKWNAAGTLLWAQQGQQNGAQSVQPLVKLTVDGAGNVTLAAHFSGGFQLGSQAVNNTTAIAVVLAQVSATGTVNWLKATTGHSAPVQVSDVAAAPDGTLYLSGSSPAGFALGTATVAANGTQWGYWLRLSGSGQVLNAQRYGTATYHDSPVATDGVGTPYVAINNSTAFSGTLRWGNYSFALPQNRYRGLFVMRLNANGVPQWVQTGSAPDSSSVQATTLKATTEFSELGVGGAPRLYVGGTCRIVSFLPNAAFEVGNLTLANSRRDFQNHSFVLALDGTMGTPQWLLPVAGSNRGDAVNALGANAAGQLSVAGEFEGDTAHFGNIQLNQPIAGFNTSAFVAKLVQNYNLAQGTVFTDTNANGQQDGTEFGRGGLIVEAQPGGYFYSTEPNGAYSAATELGTYTFSVPNPPRYYTVVPAGSPAATFTSYGNTSANHDFALQPQVNQQDLEVVLTPVSRARPGFTLPYRLTYRNVGTVALAAGTVALTFDGLLTYLSSTQPGGSQLGNTLEWPYSNLQPGETRSFDVLFQIPTTAPLGYQFNATAVVGPLPGDNTPANNTETAGLVITGSYDPNDIQVNYPTLTLPQVQSATRALDYTIRFQNMGTDTAFTVVLRDELPTDLLNLGTLQLLAASHNCTWRLTADGALTVRFDNIRLPHSGVNTIRSQGFVRFRAVPHITLGIGDQIPNAAAIHFDYNPAVSTNTALTTVLSPTGRPAGRTQAELAAWPNPAHDVLTVQLPQGATTVCLLDGLGRTVRTQAAPAGSATAAPLLLDVRGLPAGLYTLRAGLATRRLVLK